MRMASGWTLVLVVGFAMVLAVVTLATAQIKVPPDFTFEGAKDSPGPVTFSHERHRAKLEQCNACHIKVFKMKKGATGPLTMETMKAGEQCGVCHTGKALASAGGVVVFTVDDKANCEKCHKK